MLGRWALLEAVDAPALVAEDALLRLLEGRMLRLTGLQEAARAWVVAAFEEAGGGTERQLARIHVLDNRGPLRRLRAPLFLDIRGVVAAATNELEGDVRRLNIIIRNRVVADSILQALAPWHLLRRRAHLRLFLRGLHWHIIRLVQLDRSWRIGRGPRTDLGLGARVLLLHEVALRAHLDDGAALLVKTARGLFFEAKVAAILRVLGRVVATLRRVAVLKTLVKVNGQDIVPEEVKVVEQPLARLHHTASRGEVPTRVHRMLGNMVRVIVAVRRRLRWLGGQHGVDRLLDNDAQVGDKHVAQNLVGKRDRVVLKLVDGVSTFLHDVGDHLRCHRANILLAYEADRLVLQCLLFLLLDLHLLDGLLDDAEKEALGRDGRLLAAGDDLAEELCVDGLVQLPGVDEALSSRLLLRESLPRLRPRR